MGPARSCLVLYVVIIWEVIGVVMLFLCVLSPDYCAAGMISAILDEGRTHPELDCVEIPPMVWPLIVQV